MTGVRVARSKLQWFSELRGADLTNAEFRVLTILATFTDAAMTNAFPGSTRLATESRVSEPTLKKALKSLQSKGWIRLTQEGGNQYGKGKANVWSLTVPGEKAVADRTPSEPSKGDSQLPPSDPGKGVTDLPPSSRDCSRDVTPDISTREGGKSAYQGGKSTPSEGGNSLTPHQVTTSGHEKHQVISSALVSNARERSANDREKERDFQISRMDQQIPGGFRKGERARARELLDDGVPVTTILYKHLMPDRNNRPTRTYLTAQEAQR